jgi:AraC-like DNA-binding protein
MVFYSQYRPAPALASLIECYWAYRCTPEFECVEPLIPGGRVELVFTFDTHVHWLITPENPDGQPMSRAHFLGQRDRAFAWRPVGPTDLLGIRFKPGALAAFTPVPVSTLLNRLVPAEDILAVAVGEWEDRLCRERTTEGKTSLLDQLLLDLLRRNSAALPVAGSALELIRRHPDETSVQTICRQTGMYYKKLERLFETSVGYSPKQYYRIVRFNKAIRLMNRFKPLTSICYDCGYFDQSHFIREFQRFAGMTPGSFKPGEQTIAGLLIRHQPV